MTGSYPHLGDGAWGRFTERRHTHLNIRQILLSFFGFPLGFLPPATGDLGFLLHSSSF